MPTTAKRRLAAERYIETCRYRIPTFVGRHFSFKGAVALHRAALGADLWRAPLNTLLAVPTFFIALTAHMLRRVKLGTPAMWLERLPVGVTTAVECEIERLVFTEVLALPIEFRRTLTRNSPLGVMVRRYARTRSAATELGVNVLMLCAGALVFHELTPGSISTGTTMAGALAERAAIEAFPLGSWAGQAYYAVFPVSPTPVDIGITVALTMGAVALLSSFAGVLVDPLQAALGLHRRRLERLVDTLERRILGADANFQPRDAYFARLVDLVDAARAAGSLLP